MAGNQDLLYERVAPDLDHEYLFDIEVANLSTGERATKHARILLPADGNPPPCEIRFGADVL